MNKPMGRAERLNVERVLKQAGSTHKGIFRLRNWVVAAIVVAAAGAFWLTRNGGSSPATSYITAPVTRGALSVLVTATGSVQPTNQVDVSSELSGIVRKVHVDYNSPVKVGQVMAELDTDKLKATVDSSRAKLNAAKAKVSEAEATVAEKEEDFNRKSKLVEKQITSTFDFEAARAAYRRALAGLESARADVGVAEADLQLNETNLAKAEIRSPINGVILSRAVEPGQTVASTLQAPVLFSIAEDLKQMEIQVDVDEADVGKVSEGQKATFTVDAYPDRTFDAEIRQLRFGSETVSGVVTYKAVLTTDNSELLLRPGMTATAEISVEHLDDAVLVPNAALRFTPPRDASAEDNGGILSKLLGGMPRFRRSSPVAATGRDRTVWVLQDGAPKAVDVVIGVTDGQRTQIVKGDIEPGTPVIVDTGTAKKGT
jgi:HlyD family secretion protein